MPGFLMHVNAVMTCFHQAGQATIPPTQPRVLVNGQPVHHWKELIPLLLPAHQLEQHGSHWAVPHRPGDARRY